MALMIVMRILSIFKIKGFVPQSRLERIPSSLSKTIIQGIGKSSFKQKRYSQMEEEEKLWKTMDC